MHWKALITCGAAALLLSACGSDSDAPEPVVPPAPPDEHAGGDTPGKRPPNILFVIMDDVGIDQMASFGYGGLTAPALPNMDAVANAGLRFRNTWAMPECSPSRAAAFVGRYPVRTGVYAATGPNDLANSQVSPYETTVPMLLRQAGYESALFGKFHLAGPEHNEAGHGTPALLGWDHFHGWVGGLPGSIDATAGGIVAEPIYGCGFVPGSAAGGADTGACHYPDRSCTPMSSLQLDQQPAGLQCLDSGGIFVPGQACGAPPPTLDFTRENAYYVSPLVIIKDGQVEQVPFTDPRARGYRTTIEADAAIDWIKARAGSDQPWMATVSFSAAHTPLQQPPARLVPERNARAMAALDCTDRAQVRAIQDRMTEAMDHEFGRILIETGLATPAPDGGLVYDPAATNTVIVIVGDNGSLGFSVKAPFNAQRAKGTAYQTGVWVPLTIAGPQVQQPDRDVEHMVNMVDLFQFFGELAGIDVHQAVPRTVDSAPVLPYLTNPEQASLRSTNFTITGYNAQAGGARNGPCIMSSACSQVPMSKGVCEDNQGIWWGPGYTDDSVIDNGGAGYASCCQVNQALHLAGREPSTILPEVASAIRNERYKLVQNTTQHYDIASNTCGVVMSTEFYEVDQAAPTPLLDNADKNLLQGTLTAQAQQAYDDLSARLAALLASEPDCPGDGNRDGVVDATDQANWQRIAMDWGHSSVYDFPVDGVHDGLTNHVDGMVVQRNQGLECPRRDAVR